MENRLGYLGTAVAISSGLFGWLGVHEAELRITSLTISLVVGLFALGYWIKRLVKDLTRWWRNTEEDFQPPAT